MNEINKYLCARGLDLRLKVRNSIHTYYIISIPYREGQTSK